jgi:suppressor for copper-sensitivity B
VYKVLILLRFLLALAFLAASALSATWVSGGARAAAGPWLEQEHARVRLIAAGATAGAGDALRLGLQFELQPGWKIYWRAPGDAGYPPQLDWSGTAGLESAELRWPVPHRFTLFGLETFGYADAVVLPISVTPSQAGAPLQLSAALTYLACSEVCVPHDGVLTLALPAGPETSSPDVSLIEHYEKLVPGDGSNVGLALESAHLVAGGEAPLLEVVARSAAPFAAPDLLVEAPPGFVFERPEVSLSDGGTRALLRLASARGPAAEGVLEGKRLTLTLIDGARGLETEVISRYGAATALPATPDGGSAAPRTGAGASLLVMLGLAVLGGLILNLMPCVLPVLSIKLLSAVGHGGRDRGAVRLSFLASAAGILVSFLLLAAVAVGLKSAGLAAGWGIQFQQPLFLSAMALIVTLFALNLFGLFEIILPGQVADLAASVGGPGARAPGAGHSEPTLVGHFLTGAFATLLATPCSAPFLGTAVGFALAHGAAEIFAIFAALGLGLALPYLLVAAVPALATRLPRPGPWMVWLRRLLGLALAATAAWLLSVLAAQSGLTAALTVALLLIGLGVLLTLRHRKQVVALAVLAALLAVAAPLAFPAAERDAAPVLAEQAWQPFDQARIDALVAQGSVVFVDVTADWCITCQVNKSLVLDREPVAARLADGAVVAMRADWTRPSDEIAAYLASFGRYGIPFNAVYGPALPRGEALPELLTSAAVLAALARAQGGAAALAGR